MVSSPPQPKPTESPAPAGGRFQQALRLLDLRRREAMRIRYRRLLLMGLGASLMLHLLVLALLGLIYRWTPPQAGPEGASVEFTLVHDQMLDDEALEFDIDSLAVDEILAEAIDGPENVPEIDLPVDTPATAMDIPGADGADALAPLGGAGENLGGGAGGASGGTTYFGIGGTGRRFAYIIDRSGSMGAHSRMDIANAELIRSIRGLPDYAQFHIVYFSTEIHLPPMQRGWVSARPTSARSVLNWIVDVHPTGGTLPRPAFEKVFRLDPRPDVIYFMTDGIIAPQNLTAEEVAAMNRRGRPVVIHTIAFGDQGSEQLLRQISRDSGGQYRYVRDKSAGGGGGR